LLEAVRKSSHRPSATDLVKNQTLGPNGETKKQILPKAAETVQNESPKNSSPLRFKNPHARKSLSKGIGM